MHEKLKLAPSALSLLAHLIRAFNCHTEKRNTKRVERKVAILAVLADGKRRVESHQTNVIMCGRLYCFLLHECNFLISTFSLYLICIVKNVLRSNVIFILIMTWYRSQILFLSFFLNFCAGEDL
jgi:hypothetical protein